MCGIVCYFGQAEGITRVLEALYLLQYRAPDSAGLATLTGPYGDMTVRRSVGTPRQLVARTVAAPLFQVSGGNDRLTASLLSRQGVDIATHQLRDCSPSAGYALHHLFDSTGLSVGIGDRGAFETEVPVEWERGLSARMRRALEIPGDLSSPDFDQDPVRHAFRLVAAHVASRAALDQSWRDMLDRALLARVPTGSYTSWAEAWEEECATNVPGRAFAVAVHQYQDTFPGLSQHLAKDDWERVGGLTAHSMAHIVCGHGRWAMVGAVTEANAHPLLDRGGTRVVCENGSHNAPLVLGMRSNQEAWWRARGVAEPAPVHRSQNTTEVIAYEWERAVYQLTAGDLDNDEEAFRRGLMEWDIRSSEEQGLRLALRRLRRGNAHACALYSRVEPGVLYISSHCKPIAIAIRTTETEEGLPRHEAMVASDIEAALMLWPGREVDAIADRIQALNQSASSGAADAAQVLRKVQVLLDRFPVDVIYLDSDLYQGRELLARISNRIEDGRVVLDVEVTLYDGTPVVVAPKALHVNPATVGRRSHDTYTEYHLAEIPDVLDDIVSTYAHEGALRLGSIWERGRLRWQGMNLVALQDRFGSQLQHLRRIWLIGEGSSWHGGQAAAPLFRELLPGIVINVYRPVEVLNIGEIIDPVNDLVIEVSWSGTTDSVLKVDDLLGESDVMRLGITGRPQSDLGRRTSFSAGALDVRSGVEVSVATVKGYEAILAVLNLVALQLCESRGDPTLVERLAQLSAELTLVIPAQVRMVINDEERRRRIRAVAQRCRHYDKVAVVGTSPVDLEGEQKIEELAQIVACAFEFYSASLRSLIERSAIASDKRQRILFVVNATAPDRQNEAREVIDYLSALGVFCIIHTIPHAGASAWEATPTAEVFVSPSISDLLQPMIDAPFFFDLAVGLAYARGLSPEEIDRPRNLAKSVTTTGAERRAEVETHQQFRNVTLADFGSKGRESAAWDSVRAQPSKAALQATVALRATMAVMSRPLSGRLTLSQDDDVGDHVVVITDTEATANAALMAAAAWKRLLGMHLTVYRRFISELPDAMPGANLLRIIRAGAVLSVQDPHTIALPTDMSPMQLELLASVYLTVLAVRMARRRGLDTTLWEAGLAQLPILVAEVLSDPNLSGQAGAALSPFVLAGYDKVQVIGGGQDYASACSIARSLRMEGFMAEALYTDSAWYGPLAAVGGPDAEHDALIVILATDPLVQAAALADTQVYRTRHAPVLLVVPDGNQDLPAVRGVEPSAVLAVPAVPRPFVPVPNVALGAVLAREMARLWEQKAP